MAESMIERVARAIEDANLGASGDEDYTPLARAAIDAMYEPTDAMIDAGQWQVDPVSLYKSFVVAALNEQVSG